MTVTAAIAAAAVLYLVFRSAQGRITRQTVALLEATRRDPFTGMLNHGALVETIGDGHRAPPRDRAAGSRSRSSTSTTSGSSTTPGATPRATRRSDAVSDLLKPLVPTGLAVGRYGPDEFLVAVEGPAVGTLQTRAEGVRHGARRRCGSVRRQQRPAAHRQRRGGALPRGRRLGDRAPRQRRGHAPRGAGRAAATPSLVTGFEPDAVVAVAHLRRVPGPDPRRRRQGPLHEAPLRGRRPLRDVHRVADRDRRRTRSATLRLAGLLHDVGKVGIPDQILRKPGKLTDAEFDVVKQHVALGDAILRDLPDLDADPRRRPPPPRALGRARLPPRASRARTSRSSPGSSPSPTRSRR